MQLATRLILEEALEAEARDALGRDYYERGAEEGQGYRNGHRTGRVKNAEGAIEFSAPQIAAVRKDLHAEYKTSDTTSHAAQQAPAIDQIPSTSQT